MDVRRQSMKETPFQSAVLQWCFCESPQKHTFCAFYAPCPLHCAAPCIAQGQHTNSRADCSSSVILQAS